MIYQATPDYYNDVIAHRDHKYISKHRGRTGKWIYKYYSNKSKKAEKRAKQYRDELYNVANYQNMPVWAETPNIRKNYKDKAGRNLGLFEYRTADKFNTPLQRSGRPSSAGWDSGREGSKNVKTTKVTLPKKPKHGGYTSSSNASQTKKKVSTTRVGLNNASRKGYSSSTSGSQSKKSVETTKINRNKARLAREANFVTRKRKKNKRISGVGKGIGNSSAYTVTMPSRRKSN